MPLGRAQRKVHQSRAPSLGTTRASVSSGVPAEVPAEEGGFPVNSVRLLQTVCSFHGGWGFREMWGRD